MTDPTYPAQESNLASGSMSHLEAPGYKTAKVFGILSICSAVTCVGFPLAVIFGILALVKQAKAKRIAREALGTYRNPPAGAMVMGIVGLGIAFIMVPILGVSTAIAIPAVIAQRERSRLLVLQKNILAVQARADEFIQTGQGQPMDPQQLLESLLNDPTLAQLKNPYNPGAPALERAENPSGNGTIAMWPATNSREDGGTDTTITLVANYLDDQDVQQLSETITVFSTGAPEPLTPEEPIPAQ